jgi:hypothetical protein
LSGAEVHDALLDDGALGRPDRHFASLMAGIRRFSRAPQMPMAVSVQHFDVYDLAVFPL